MRYACEDPRQPKATNADATASGKPTLTRVKKECQQARACMGLTNPIYPCLDLRVATPASASARVHFSRPSCSRTIVFSCAMRQMTMPKTALATMSANEYPTCSNAVAFEAEADALEHVHER